MKIAVTGASGFIGQYVLEALSSESCQIVAITRDAHRLIRWRNRASIVQMDIGSVNADSFEHLGQPDLLIHLAWDGLPNYRSLHHFETELPKQYRFLKAMIEAGLSALLVTGTCFEYGMQSGLLSENLPVMPNNPYAYAKDALRQQLGFLRIKHPFNFTWARLFYMYGEGQPASSIYSQLKKAVSSGERHFNMSGGEQLRDYLHVSEVARIIVQLALRQSDIGVLNVCAGKPISVRRLVERWLGETGWNIALNLGFYPYPDHEPMAFWGNRQQLNNILDER